MVRRRPEEDDSHAGEIYNFHHGYEIIVDKFAKQILPVRTPRNPDKDPISKVVKYWVSVSSCRKFLRLQIMSYQWQFYGSQGGQR